MGLYLEPHTPTKFAWFRKHAKPVSTASLLSGNYPKDQVPIFYADGPFEVLGVGFSETEIKRFADRLAGSVAGLVSREEVELVLGRKLPR